jgi:Tfp pilus assembly protein PilO
MLTDIILIGAMCLAYGYWFNAQKAKEIALAAARDHCLTMEVQMLDDYVALIGIRLNRDNIRKIQLWRSFLFEFSSTGNERYNGTVLMQGCRVESIVMDPYRIEQTGNYHDEHYFH